VLDALAAAWLLYVLFAFSGAGISPVTALVAGGGGLALAVAWVWLVRASPSLAPLALAFVPAACLLIAVLLLFGRPPHNPLFRVRFLASRDELARTADGVLVYPPAPGRRRIGLFRVDLETADGEVRFLTGDCAPRRRCGISYLPTGRPGPGRRQAYTSLGGPWYHLAE
jgi:hypothetical protein